MIFMEYLCGEYAGVSRSFAEYARETGRSRARQKVLGHLGWVIWRVLRALIRALAILNSGSRTLQAFWNSGSFSHSFLIVSKSIIGSPLHLSVTDRLEELCREKQIEQVNAIPNAELVISDMM